MVAIPVYTYFEDVVTQAVLEKLISVFPAKFAICARCNCRGQSRIKANFSKYINMARNGIVCIVVTDLDRYSCVLDLKNKWNAFELPHNLIFRIAVHEVESWLLADNENFSKSFSVPLSKVPQSPDEIIDVKEGLISIIRKSRNRALRKGIIPIDDYATIGPEYNEIITRYVQEVWSVQNACLNSPSFCRAFCALEQFRPENEAQ